MTDQHIYETIDALGVRIKYTPLPPDRDGDYDDRKRLIRLVPAMPRRLHRSVLAHECAHAVFADRPSPYGPVNAKQERRADEWAALRLIEIDGYKTSESIHLGHVEAMAVELDVTVDLVLAFRRVLVRLGDTVYVQPKMGAGMWSYRETVH